MSELPDPMPPVLADALRGVPPEVATSFLGHLRGGTSADYLAEWLRRLGSPVSATTLKRYRGSLINE